MGLMFASVFKSLYKRHTNFAIETIEEIFINNINMHPGNSNTSTAGEKTQKHTENKPETSIVFYYKKHSIFYFL